MDGYRLLVQQKMKQWRVTQFHSRYSELNLLNQINGTRPYNVPLDDKTVENVDNCYQY